MSGDHLAYLPQEQFFYHMPYTIALRLSLSSAPLGLPLWASLSAFVRFSNTHWIAVQIGAGSGASHDQSTLPDMWCIAARSGGTPP